MSESCDCLAVSMPSNQTERWRDDCLHRRGSPCMRGEEVARLAMAERDEARAEVERLHPALRLHVEQLQELLGASREEVRRLTHAARLVIKEHSCGDIDACSVCGPLESALAGEGETNG